MTEKALQTAVVELAGLLGYRVYHTFDSRRSHAGWPDLVLVRGPRLLFVELKSAAGKLSVEQERWLAALELTRAETFVWRPADWLDGTVEKLLRTDALGASPSSDFAADCGNPTLTTEGT